VVITYSNSPEYSKRQPSGDTLTEAQAAELNERQAMLLPDVNTGMIRGNMDTSSRLEGSLSLGSMMDGVFRCSPRISGIMRVRRL